MPYRHAVVITAAGSSRRFNESLGKDSNSKKEFLTIDGKSILYRSVSAFVSVEGLAAVAVTYREGDRQLVMDSLQDIPERLEKLGIPLYLVVGGETRQASVFNGLLQLERSEAVFDFVSIHDGARPFVTEQVILDCLDKASKNGGAVAAIPVSDTLLKVSEDNCICGAVDRNCVYRAQTPQTFDFKQILAAHRKAAQDGANYTDDTQVFIAYGKKVAVACGDEDNVKITYAKDLKGAFRCSK